MREIQDINILAIESSCDETAAAVVHNGREVRSNIISSQIDLHKLYGGVVPEIASRKHIEKINQVIEEALKEADTTLDEIDAIGVTYGPGLVGALLVGVAEAKAIAFAKNKPLVGVHHIEGHISANYVENKELEPPFVALVVSGGHTHLVKVNDYGEYEIVGRTRDDAAGEAFDKAARTMGMPYPGGIALDKVAEDGDPFAFKLPRPTVSGSQYDFSFSGLKTAVINLIHNSAQKGIELNKADVCASFRYAVVDCLKTNFLKAAEDLKVDKLVIAGGVSANRLLRSSLQEECDKHGLAFYMPEKSLCGDNAAMVGSQGYYEFLSGNIASTDLNAFATMSIEL